MDANTLAELVTVARWIVLLGFVGVPVLGLTIRLAIKPLVDAMVQLREAPPVPPGDDGSVVELRRELEEVRALLHRVMERQEFDVELLRTTGSSTRERRGAAESRTPGPLPGG